MALPIVPVYQMLAYRERQQQQKAEGSSTESAPSTEFCVQFLVRRLLTVLAWVTVVHCCCSTHWSVTLVLLLHCCVA